MSVSVAGPQPPALRFSAQPNITPRFASQPLIGPATPAETAPVFAMGLKFAGVNHIRPLGPLRFAGSNRLVVASNRGPGTLDTETGEFKKSAGGLVTALSRAGVDSWFYADKGGPSHLAKDGNIPFDLYGVHLTQQEEERYYENYSNRVLWPALHGDSDEIRTNVFGRLTTADLANYEEDWQAYQKVNQRFADIIAREGKKEDLTWIQDYHLLLAPGMIREQKPNAKLGFFCHIPFPSPATLNQPDVQRVLPPARLRELFDGMLGSDLLGFHTQEYVDNFIDVVKAVMGDDVQVNQQKDEIVYRGRKIRVEVHPISIDTEQIRKIKDTPATKAMLQKFYREMPEQHVGIGVDRLDYTKGIMQRLHAIEIMLDRDKKRANPQYMSNFRFIQIAAPSRSNVKEYQELEENVLKEVGRINAKFATPTWQPINFIHNDTPISTIVPLFQRADFGLVTPLKDGMNLVAKEFCAAQDEDAPGTLILSKEAGAAQELGSALMVDPTSPEDIANQMEAAMQMPHEERKARMLPLQRQVLTNDVHEWRKRFIHSFEACTKPQATAGGKGVLNQLKAPKNLLLMLDYDGTLTPLVSRPEDAQISQRRIELLKRVAQRPNTRLAIVSGRSVEQLQGFLGDLKGLPVVLAGLHGGQIYDCKTGQFLRKPTDAQANAIAGLAANLQGFEARYPGIQLENKGYSLALHYRNAQSEQIATDALEAFQTQIDSLGLRSEFVLKAGKKVLELVPKSCNKGDAAEFLKQHFDAQADEPYYSAYFGDDLTDEDAFAAVNRQGGLSVHVGESDDTAANATLKSDRSLCQVLNRLGE